MDAFTQLLSDWQLTAAGDRLPGRALVQPVRTVDARTAVLKLASPEGWHAGQVPALKAWAGDGTVEVLRAKPSIGALLLEPLYVERLPQDPELTAVAALWGRLHRPAPAALPRLSDLVPPVLDRLHADPRGAGVPPRLAQQAVVTGRRLLDDAPAAVALHGALRAEHLGRRRAGETVALAPLGLAGDPDAEAFGVLDAAPGSAALLQERFWALVDALAAAGVEADERRLRDWTVVLAIVTACGTDDSSRVTQLVSLAKAVGSVQIEFDW